MLLANKEGIVVVGPVVNLNLAAIGNAAIVFTIPVLVNQLLGTKSVKIKKVSLYNNAAGATQVIIGTGQGIGFLPLLPALDSFNGLMDTYGEQTDLIEAEAFADITAYPVALGVGTSIDIQLEVAIIG